MDPGVLNLTAKPPPLPVGNTIFESRTLNSSLNAQSTVFLQQPGKASRLDGETFGCQFAWSGNWRVHIEASYDQSLRIHLGENPVDSQRSDEAGDSFATPLVLADAATTAKKGFVAPLPPSISAAPSITTHR